MCPIINLPKSDNGCNKQSYSFSLSNVETEGPQGGFECLRQSGLRSLESLGCMLHKMQIHANEDSYEKTRVKMAAVEKENKKFCTKEIKPSGPYLGRKVKVKRPNAIIPPKPSSPPLPVSLSKPIPKPPISSNSIVTSGSQFHSSTNNSRQVPINKGVKTSEIMRKTVRERIIHLLALRPYKKPELLARLLRDGIKEKEKKGISAILCQIAVLKDNAYHLANHAWIEVQDNWPFYSAEEAETIRKRRRPPANTQNENRIPSPSITQPNTSPVQKRSSEYEVHGSKKQRISHYNKVDNASSNSNSSFPSRNDYSGTVSGDKSEDAPDHFFKKDSVDGNVRTNLHANTRQKSPDVNGTFWSNGVHSQKNSVNNESGKHSTHDVLGLSQKNCSNDDVKDSNPQSSCGLSQKSYAYNDVDKPSHNPPLGISQKNNITHGHHHSSGAGQRGFVTSDTEKSNCHNTFSASQKTHEVDRSDHYMYANQTHKNYASSETEKTVQHVRCLPNLRVESSMRPADSSQTIVARVSPDSNSHIQGAPRYDFYGDKPVTNGYGYNNQLTRHESAHHRKNQPKVSSTTNGSGGSSPRTSPDSQDSMDYCGSENEDHSSDLDGCEFLKQYVVIGSLDQRARYKADFNAEYEEYRYLHSKMKNVSKRFAALEDQLNAFEEGSAEWHRIKGQIYREYEDNKHDPKYQGVRRKFNFLHKKLSHIKKLVMEYDNAQAVKS